MKKRRAGLIAGLALFAAEWLSPAHAAVPAPGTPEGEILCAGFAGVLASGALLTTGADPLAAARAHGVFLGRLSVIAPDAKYRVQDYLDAYDKMTPAEQEQLVEGCVNKLQEIDARQNGSQAKDR